MDSKKQVVSMLAAQDKITLFTITGEMVVISQDGHYDIPKITEYLTPKLTGTSVVEIDLNEFTSIGQALKHMEFEDEGVIITRMVNGKEIQGIFYPQKITVSVKVDETLVDIPNVENLENHVIRAAAENSPSVANFLKRVARVIKDRKHSAEDLMHFIKRSEMPLTNDGRIIAYKRVNAVNGSEGYFVDVHSGTIKQRVGSRVTMPLSMVDPSRYQSCSTGLHVANLGYLGGFHGSHTLMVLVDPENFIAVPIGEDTKARVSSYDIIGVVTDSAHSAVNSGHVKNDPHFQAMVQKAILGEIKDPIEEIFVGQKEITKVVSLNSKPKAQKTASQPKTKPSGKSLLEDAVTRQPVDIVAKVRETKAESMPEQVVRAFEMLRNGLSKTVVASNLFTSTRSIGRWIEKWGDPLKVKLPDESKEVNQEDLEAAAEMAPEILSRLASTQSDATPMTLQDQARQLFVSGNFVGLKEFKKVKKKSWTALGFKPEEIGQIEKAD